VTFEGYVPRARLVDLLSHCSAYLVPGEEDFGIAPVEAMAAGKPVVAIDRGGTAETVVDGVSGVLFAHQSEQGLVGALDRLSNMQLDPIAIRRRAERFDRAVFRDEFRALLAKLKVDPSLVARG
jgi:glycosyltransferase involved in cell wall biosynthesis